MKEAAKRHLLTFTGFVFVFLGVLGIVLPLLPTTPFLIVALICFAESSPKFHQMLLNNKWVGEDLRRWEQDRAITRAAKKKATVVIVLTFSISITILSGRWPLQLFLVIMASALLTFLWRFRESPE